MLAELVRALALRVFSAVFMAKAVSEVAAGDIMAAKQNIFYFLILFCSGLIIGSVGDLIALHTENLNYKKQILDFYLKLTGKDMSFYRDHQTGYLASAFRQYLDSTLLLIRFFRLDVIGSIISLVVPAIVLLLANLPVGLLALAIIFVQVIYVVWASAKSNKYRALSHELYRKITGEVADDIMNIVSVKAGDQAKNQSRMEKLASQENSAFWLMRRNTTLLDLPRSLITALGVAAAFYVIIASSTSTPSAIGLIVLTMTYMLQIVRSVSDLPSLILRHDDLTTKLYPTLQFLETDQEKVVDPLEPKSLDISLGAISIENISFSYQPNTKKRARVNVFSEFNLEIAGGERVGVVGLSGMGKSTLASLLMRFDDVDSGSIKVDGFDLCDVKQAELRQKIAYVPQEPLLFHRSIRENIAYFNPEASEAEIVNAAKAAHAHQFIEHLPDGYNTMVGERGVKLSGGQKQRVVIARAILKQAPIMIFDEATSALDSESEQIIQRALPEIIGHQTAIIIAHRLSTVAGLDRIIVIHNGIIEEEGTHAELLKKKGRYYSLWQRQTANHQ